MAKTCAGVQPIFGPTNQPQPIPPLGTLLQATILFPSEAELAKTELGF